MAFTDNQVDTAVQSATGRAATPYEIKTFSNASPLTIANLKNYYSGLNSDKSIHDYLLSKGQDPATMQDLGKQYGIANIGTAEGNTALLAALKAGTPPPSTPVAPVGGSIVPPTPPVIPVDPNTPINGSITGATVGNQNPQGLSNDQVSGGDGQPPQIAGLTDAYNSYTSVQSQVADIDNTLRQSEQDIRDEITKSGGLVDASQLKALVYDRNKPLLAQRDVLVAQQAQAGKMYTDLLARQKESDANFYNSQKIGQGQEKIDQSGQKITDQEQQFITKMQQAGISVHDVAYTDENGNTQHQLMIVNKDGSMKPVTQADLVGSGVSTGGATGSTTAPTTDTTPTTTVTTGNSIVDGLLTAASSFAGIPYITQTQFKDATNSKTSVAATKALEKAGVPNIIDADAKVMDSVQNSQGDLTDFANAIKNGVLPKDASGQPMQYAKVTWNKFLQTNPKIAAFASNLLVSIALIPAIKGTGSGGGGGGGATLYKTVSGALPTSTDTVATAMTKLQTIMGYLNNSGYSVLGISKVGQEAFEGGYNYYQMRAQGYSDADIKTALKLQ